MGFSKPLQISNDDRTNLTKLKHKALIRIYCLLLCETHTHKHAPSHSAPSSSYILHVVSKTDEGNNPTSHSFKPMQTGANRSSRSCHSPLSAPFFHPLSFSQWCSISVATDLSPHPAPSEHLVNTIQLGLRHVISALHSSIISFFFEWTRQTTDSMPPPLFHYLPSNPPPGLAVRWSTLMNHMNCWQKETLWTELLVCNN